MSKISEYANRRTSSKRCSARTLSFSAIRASRVVTNKPAHEAQRDDAAGRQAGGVTSHELRRAIAEGVRARDDGARGEMPAQIFGELLNRIVSARRIRAQRHEQDVVQIAAQAATEPLRRAFTRGAATLGTAGLPGAGAGGARAGTPDRGARPARLPVLHRRRQCQRRAPPRVGWLQTGEQLIQHQTQRIDIARRRDRLAPDLFRACVVRVRSRCKLLVPWSFSALAPDSRIFAIPKSRSFGAPSAPTRILLGFKSRCTIRRWCAYWTAPHTKRNKRRRALTSSLRRSQ